MENIKEKALFLLKYYAVLILCFIPLRLLFMYLSGIEQYALSDYIDVAIHGMPLDIAVAGYFTSLPLLLCIAGTFVYVPTRKLLIVYNIFAAIAIATAFIADISLYPFWEFKLDASFLIYIDSPLNAFASVSTTYIIIRLIAIIALVAIIFTLLHKATPKSLRPEKRRFATLTMLIITGGMLFLGIRGGIGESTNNIGKVYYSDKQFLNHSAVNPIFSFIYSIGKREDYSESYHFFGEEELEARFKELYRQDATVTDTLLNTTRPNIITIILEGMNSSLIESQGGEKGITPNFDRLSKEGVLFSECYANSYRTDRGLICALSGYASFPKTSVMKSPVKSQGLASIASTLGKVGYHNTFLYGGDINFTNMKSYFFSTGYNELIADKDFSIEEQNTHLWGVADHITFDTLSTLIKNRPKEPWHITYLTLSSHEPWTVPYNRIPDNKIANSFAYTDSCFGDFIDKLKNSPEWKNTLVICIPDHSVARFPEKISQSNPNRNRIPILLLGGAVRNPQHITTICNQSDLPATILSQLALPIEDFKFSRNILSPSYDMPFAYHSYNNGISFIDSTGFTLYDLDSYNITAETPADINHIRLNKAKAILQYTYRDFITDK